MKIKHVLWLITILFFMRNNMFADDIHQIIKTRRSVRKFKQTPVAEDVLKKIVDDARYAPSGGNVQPWEFIVVNDPVTCPQVFAATAWLKAAGKPEPNEQPTAYIVVVANPALTDGYLEDCAAATQTILLSAWAEGVGSCWIGALKQKPLRAVLQVPDKKVVTAVVALGYPSESPISEKKKDYNSPYRDTKGQLHVPKKALDDILYFNKYGSKK